MNPRAFKGILTPVSNNFTIDIDCLIVRSNEIAFEMHGRYSEYPYDVEGKSTKQPVGYYKGPGRSRDPETNAVLSYVEFFSIIYILEYMITDIGCDTEGFRFERVPKQEPIGGWLFGGSLELQCQERPL